MFGSTIEQDAIKNNNVVVEDIGEPIQEFEQPEQNFDFLGWLKKPTGEGEVESYVNHPLNFNGSKPVARIIRGITGLIGDINFAILDIVFGTLDFLKGKKANESIN